MLGCQRVPYGIQPVQFQPERYLGRWYEVARFDHWFERGLANTTADYSMRPDGTIQVINRGYDPVKGTWNEAHGVAKFADGRHTADLNVTFFWPFYGKYVVFALDQKHYNYAMVTSGSRDYLWILSRTPVMDPLIFTELYLKARDEGFAVEKLILVPQNGRRTMLQGRD